MLNLYERQIVCVCESCWALRSGDAEFRPTGSRTLWLEDFRLPEEIWAQFRIPIGLAFFMHSSVTDCVVALYPSPAGATESLLPLTTWAALVQAHPLLGSLAPDVEALLLRRLAGRFECFLVPIDACYELVGRLRRHWRGFDGGDEVRSEIEAFFEGLRARSDVVETAAG